MSQDRMIDAAALRSGRLGMIEQRPVAWGEEAAGLIIEITSNAVRGRPSLEESGLRVALMRSRLCPWLTSRLRAAERRALAATGRAELLSVRGCAPEVMERVFDLLTRGCEEEPRAMGRRVGLIAYLLNHEPEVKSALPSFEVIGELWGLRAANKRAAVSAAMKKLCAEPWLAVATRGGAWFNKKPVTCAKYRAVQMGNHHRAEGKEHAAERAALKAYAAEIKQGIPVKRQFAAMSPAELRRHLQKLAREEERRRLGV